MSYINTTKEDKKDFKTQLKVITLLDKINISDSVKERPRESFKILCECIYYTSAKYQTIKEVRFFESGKCESVKVIRDLSKFKDWNYDDFKKEILSDLNITDIRESLISFNISKELIEEPTEPPEIVTPEQTGKDRTTL